MCYLDKAAGTDWRAERYSPCVFSMYPTRKKNGVNEADYMDSKAVRNTADFTGNAATAAVVSLDGHYIQIHSIFTM